MKQLHRLLLCLLFATPLLLSAAPDGVPHVLLLDGPALVAAKASLARVDSPLQPALAALRKDAERALKLKPPSVMHKALTAASGDKHDYFSFGPYWWPDPAKPDGLPYIRRDGQVNPASRTGTDDGAFGHMKDALATLGLAYWFTGDERYAQKAAEVARVWFLDPATRMNPNLQHAQAIPGRTDGRGIGLIDSRDLPEVNDDLALLALSPAWTAADRTAFQEWLSTFYRWLATAPNGRTEHAEKNNHGTWYDAQSAGLALALGRNSDARRILTEGLSRRLTFQVEPDGRQPLELARTNSLNYSCFNLEALFTCARLAGFVGVDWWHFTTPDGRSLHAALAYLASYVDPAKAWPKADIRAAKRDRLLSLLTTYLQHRADPEFDALWKRFAPTEPADARWRLLHNLPPGAEPVPVPDAPAESR